MQYAITSISVNWGFFINYITQVVGGGFVIVWHKYVRSMTGGWVGCQKSSNLRDIIYEWCLNCFCYSNESYRPGCTPSVFLPIPSTRRWRSKHRQDVVGHDKASRKCTFWQCLCLIKRNKLLVNCSRACLFKVSVTWSCWQWKNKNICQHSLGCL